MPAQVDLGVVQKALEWLKTKLYLNTQTISAQRRNAGRSIAAISVLASEVKCRKTVLP